MYTIDDFNSIQELLNDLSAFSFAGADTWQQKVNLLEDRFSETSMGASLENDQNFMDVASDPQDYNDSMLINEATNYAEELFNEVQMDLQEQVDDNELNDDDMDSGDFEELEDDIF